MSKGWRAGKYARVGLSLRRTYDHHGSDSLMETMKGKRYKIKEVEYNTIKLWYNEMEGRYFYFEKSDLTLCDDDVKITYPKPEKFDPTNLVT